MLSALKIGKNNGGYSLVELMVTVMISAVLLGIVGIFISTSKTTYEIVDTDAVLQEEAEAVSSFIREVAIEAEQYYEGSFTKSGSTNKVIYFKAPDNEGTSDMYFYFFVNAKGDSTVRFKKIKDDRYREEGGSVDKVPVGSGLTLTSLGQIDLGGTLGGIVEGAGAPYAMLAEHVNDINISSSGSIGEEQGKLISIKIDLSYRGEAYSTEVVVTGRNYD